MPRKTAQKSEPAVEKKPARAKASAAMHKTPVKRTSRAAAVAQASSLPALAPFEEIERQAYFYWVERDYAPGDPTADWLRAEEEVRQRYLRRTASTRP